MKLFEEPGKKMNDAASVLFVMTCIGGIILGFIFMEDDPIIGLTIIIASALEGYVISLLLAGFGKLIETTDKINKQLSSGTNSSPDEDLSKELPDL